MKTSKGPLRANVSTGHGAEEEAMPRMLLCAMTLLFGVWFCAVAHASGSQEVEAEGMGASVEQATENAWRAAIQNVVGTYVDTTTIVDNQTLIKDEVLTHSRGFIDKYEVIGQSSSGGLVTVQIRAQVQAGTVKEKLETIGLVSIDVDGASLGASLVTQIDQAASARLIIQRQLSQVPNVMAVEASTKPEIEIDNGKTFLTQTVRVFVDPYQYELFFHETVSILAKVAVEEYIQAARGGPTTIRSVCLPKDWKTDKHNKRTLVSLLTPGTSGTRISGPLFQPGPSGVVNCHIFELDQEGVPAWFMANAFTSVQEQKVNAPRFRVRYRVEGPSSGLSQDFVIGISHQSTMRPQPDYSALPFAITWFHGGSIVHHLGFFPWLTNHSLTSRDDTSAYSSKHAGGVKSSAGCSTCRVGEIHIPVRVPITKVQAAQVERIEIELFIENWPMEDGTRGWWKIERTLRPETPSPSGDGHNKKTPWWPLLPRDTVLGLSMGMISCGLLSPIPQRLSREYQQIVPLWNHLSAVSFCCESVGPGCRNEGCRGHGVWH
jgi:hypothetical protein